MKSRIAAVLPIMAGLLATVCLAGPVSASEHTLDAANRTAVHVRDRGGECPTGFVLATATQTHKARFAKWNTRPYTKKKFRWQTIRKGQQVCIATDGTPDTTPTAPPTPGSTPWGALPTNSNGEITALPKGFPKNPTVEDIQALGLTPTTPVSSNFRIPQPAQPRVVSELPDKVTLVGMAEVIPGKIDTDPESVFYGKPARDTWITLWRVDGGRGLIRTADGYAELGGSQVLRMATSRGSQDRDGSVAVQPSTHTSDDYGQASVPTSVVRHWNIPSNDGRWDGYGAISKSGHIADGGATDGNARIATGDGGQTWHVTKNW